MNNYSFLQKQLHSIVLSNNFFKKFSYFLEKSIYEKKIKNYNKNAEHIFITGMPRSGTTIILNFLYKIKDFASLTYADMPFVLSPNLWSIFNRNVKIKYEERLHGDGISFSIQSPEAFEEVFWKTFGNDEFLQLYREYVSLILHKYQKDRYLCKNNYNYKRIELLNAIFPQSKILVPFRDPLQTSFSLLLQNNRFKSMQSKDEFIWKYMNWLGHYEFGLGHKSWHSSRSFDDPVDINYWLEQWLLFYENFLKNHKKYKNVVILNYDKLNSQNYLRKVLKKLNVRQNFSFRFKVSNRKILPNYNKDLYKNCLNIHRNLIGLT
tara:strand:- start:2463 stop:3425 length:963 start_codon:yes stop_codon:yes gene_type:complete